MSYQESYASTGGGESGDVTGPSSSTDNAVARFDGTTGKAIQNSGVIIDDSGNLTANNVSGTNTGDQTITLTGDVTGSGTGSFATTIAPDAVTYDKMQDTSTTDVILGRQTASGGTIEEITCTVAGRALLDDADASAQRTTIGLGNVDNTSDANKPVSTATQTALNLKQDYDLVLAEIAAQTITTESTTSRTLALTDANDYIRTTNSSATTITVPLNSSVAFPVGTRIEVIQAGTGETSFAATGGVTINTATGLKISAQYRAATLIKISTNEWDLIGALNA